MSSKNHNALWLSHLVSTLGERLSYVSLLIFCGKMTGEKMGPFVVMAIYTLTFVLVSPFAGIFTDNANKKKILIATDLLRSLLLLGYCFVFYINNNEFLGYQILFYTLVFLVVSFSTLARTCFWSIIPDIVDKEEIESLNYKIAINENVAMALGTAIGGWLTQVTSIKNIFIADSGTYLISLILLLNISYVFTKSKSEAKSKSKSKKRIGLSFLDLTFFKKALKETKVLENLVFLIIICLLSGMVNAYMAIIFKETLSLADSYIGYSYSLFSLGSIFLPFFAKKIGLSLKGKKSRHSLLVLLALLIITLWGSSSVSLSMTLIFLCGGLITLGTVAINTMMMKICPKENTGKMASLITISLRLSLLMGILLASNIKGHISLSILTIFLVLGNLFFSRKSSDSEVKQ